MARPLRSAEITRQPYLFWFALCAILAATSLAAAQENGAAAPNQTLSLPGYGAALQVPAGWSHRHFANVDQLVNVTPDKMATLASVDLENAAKISIGVLKLATHSDAVDRLTIVAAERQAQSTFLTIAGWPALQRQTLIPRPELGEQEESAESSDGPGRMLVLVTTAVAVGNSVVRLDGRVPAESPTANVIAGQMKAIGLGLTFQQSGDPAQAALDVQKLQSNPAPRLPNAQPGKPNSAISNSQFAKTSSTAAKNVSPAAVPATQTVGLSFNTTIGGSGTEPEIAASSNGQNIVIASQFNGVSSQNGGNPFQPCSAFQTRPAATRHSPTVGVATSTKDQSGPTG